MCGGSIALALVNLLAASVRGRTASGFTRHNVFGTIGFGGLLLLFFGFMLWVSTLFS
jgi:hypothetical protein